MQPVTMCRRHQRLLSRIERGALIWVALLSEAS